MSPWQSLKRFQRQGTSCKNCLTSYLYSWGYFCERVFAYLHLFPFWQILQWMRRFSENSLRGENEFQICKTAKSVSHSPTSMKSVKLILFTVWPPSIVVTYLCILLVQTEWNIYILGGVYAHCFWVHVHPNTDNQRVMKFWGCFSWEFTLESQKLSTRGERERDRETQTERERDKERGQSERQRESGTERQTNRDR